VSSRRDFLRVAVAGVAGLALGGVAGYYARQDEVDRLKGKVEELLGRVGIELEEDFNLFNWTWYANLELIEEWASENNINLQIDHYESNDELVSELELGARQYDVVVPSASYIPTLIERGILQPIDLDKIPNADNIPESFMGREWDPDNEYTLIYSYGTTAIAYNEEKLDEEITSWGDIFDVENPDSIIRRHSGRVTMLPESIEVMDAAAIYLGYPIDTTDENQLEDIANLLIAQKDHLYGYVGTEEYMEELPRGSLFYISQSWNGDIAGVIWDSSEREVKMSILNPHVKYVIPEEGAVAWFDNFAIPANAENIENAHAFINWFLDPVISAIHTMTVKYPFPAGIKYVPEIIRNDQTIFIPESLYDKLYWTILTPELESLWQQYWQRVQTA